MFQGSYKEGFNILLLYTLLQRILFLFISGRSEFFNNFIEIGFKYALYQGKFSMCLSFEYFKDVSRFSGLLLKYKGWF